MWTAIFATYVLYSNAEQRSAFMSFLLSAPSWDKLIQHHNMTVVRRSAQCDSLLGQFHATIEKMTVPFFPPDAEFDAINLGIVQECSRTTGVTGAGASQTTCVAAYSRVTQPGLRPHVSEVSGGDPFLPVQQMPDGSYGVDMQRPHDHATNTNRELAALRRRVAQLETATGTTNTNNNNNSTTYRGGNRGGRGGRGGGVARGGRTPTAPSDDSNKESSN
eukprot:PhM_4_TR1331/c0_g1_i2/m.48619